jgi:hypothetical protein
MARPDTEQLLTGFDPKFGPQRDIPGGEQYVCLWSLETEEDDTLLVWLHVDLESVWGAHSRVCRSQCLGDLHNGRHSRHHCQRPPILAVQVCLLVLLARTLQLWFNT